MDLLQKKQKQKWQKRLRTIFPNIDNTSTNFSSIDYLNLATHPHTKAEGVLYSIKWGSGSLPTRTLSSYESCLTETENLLANFLGHETVTFYESDANLFANITSLFERPLIYAQSVSPKTGEFTQLDDLISIKKSSNSLLAIDDSLTFSVLGTHGFGICAEKEGIDLLLGSFHKRFGSYVSYFACSKELKRELFEKIPSLHKERFIPPLYLGMINASIKLIPSMKNERKRVLQLKQGVQTAVKKIFVTTNETKAPFVPIGFSSPFELKSYKLHLADHGCIPGTSKASLLFFPNLSLTEKEIANLFLTLSNYKDSPQVEAL